MNRKWIVAIVVVVLMLVVVVPAVLAFGGAGLGAIAYLMLAPSDEPEVMYIVDMPEALPATPIVHVEVEPEAVEPEAPVAAAPSTTKTTTSSSRSSRSSTSSSSGSSSSLPTAAEIVGDEGEDDPNESEEEFLDDIDSLLDDFEVSRPEDIDEAPTKKGRRGRKKDR